VSDVSDDVNPSPKGEREGGTGLAPSKSDTVYRLRVFNTSYFTQAKATKAVVRGKICTSMQQKWSGKRRSQWPNNDIEPPCSYSWTGFTVLLAYCVSRLALLLLLKKALYKLMVMTISADD